MSEHIQNINRRAMLLKGGGESLRFGLLLVLGGGIYAKRADERLNQVQNNRDSYNPMLASMGLLDPQQRARIRSAVRKAEAEENQITLGERLHGKILAGLGAGAAGIVIIMSGFRLLSSLPSLEPEPNS